jgi:hypothetical protein
VERMIEAPIRTGRAIRRDNRGFCRLWLVHIR